MIAAYVRTNTFLDQTNKMIADQKEMIRECLVDQEYQFYVDEGISGLSEGSSFSKMKSDIEDGKINKVVALNPSRISRNAKSLVSFIYKCWDRGVTVEFLDGTNVSEFVDDIEALI